MSPTKAAFLLMVLLTAACAQAARPERMVAPSSFEIREPVDPTLKKGVFISGVTGGRGTNPLWKSEVSGPDFRNALEQSLRINGLLAADPASGRYSVWANLVDVQQPMMGFNFTVTTTIHYTVTAKDTQQLYLEEAVVTPFTARMGDAAFGTERLRLANEGSTQANIKRFIDLLMQHSTPAS
jgi:hypothetical protein